MDRTDEPCHRERPRPRTRGHARGPGIGVPTVPPTSIRSAEPRRPRCERRLDVRREAQRVMRLEPGRRYPDAPRAGDPEPVPAEHAPAALLEGGDGRVL